MNRNRTTDDKLNTLMTLSLMARYDFRPLVPLDIILEDFFGGMTSKAFLRKVTEGEIELPVVSMGAGQKATRAIHVNDLLAYIEKKRTEARRDML